MYLNNRGTITQVEEVCKQIIKSGIDSVIQVSQNLLPICFILHEQLKIQFIVVIKMNKTFSHATTPNSKDCIGKVGFLTDKENKISLLYDEPKYCSLCIEIIALPEVPYKMQCGHYYHTSCIKKQIGTYITGNFGCGNPKCQYQVSISSLVQTGVISLGFSNSEICDNCHLEFQSNTDKLKMPNCEHKFHKRCYQHITGKTSICPLCNSKNPLEEEKSRPISAKSMSDCCACGELIVSSKPSFEVECCKGKYHIECVKPFGLEEMDTKLTCKGCKSTIQYRDYFKIKKLVSPCESCGNNSGKMKMLKCGHCWHQKCLNQIEKSTSIVCSTCKAEITVTKSSIPKTNIYTTSRLK